MVGSNFGLREGSSLTLERIARTPPPEEVPLQSVVRIQFLCLFFRVRFVCVNDLHSLSLRAAGREPPVASDPYGAYAATDTAQPYSTAFTAYQSRASAATAAPASVYTGDSNMYGAGDAVTDDYTRQEQEQRQEQTDQYGDYNYQPGGYGAHIDRQTWHKAATCSSRLIRCQHTLRSSSNNSQRWSNRAGAAASAMPPTDGYTAGLIGGNRSWCVVMFLRDIDSLLFVLFGRHCC